MPGKAAKPSSTQQYLQIDAIREGIVVLKDGRLRKIIRVMPVNFDLKSEKEKEVSVYQYQSFLNSLKFPIQVVVQSRRVDLSGYIQKVEEITSKEINALLQEQGNDYLQFIKTISEEADIMDKIFYVTIGHVTKGAVEERTWIDALLNRKRLNATTFTDKDFAQYKEVIEEKARLLVSRLSSLGVTAKPLDTKELIELFYNSYNPEESYTEHLGETDKITSPIITKGKELLEKSESLDTATLPTVTNPASSNQSPTTPPPPPVATPTKAQPIIKTTSMSQIFSTLGLAHKEGSELGQTIKQGTTDVLDIISPAGMKITPSYIQLGNFFVRTLFVYTYPRYLNTNWLSPIINFDTTIDTSVFIYPLETGSLIGQLRRKTTQLQSSAQIESEKGLVRNPELETAIGDVEELRDTLQRGETRLFQMSLYFTVFAKSLDELNKVSKQIEGVLGGQLTYTKQALLQMEQGFASTLPMLDDELSVKRNFDTESLSTAFPFTSAELSHHDGVLYGVNLHNNSLVLFDRFRMENANQVVFAKSGAGKSYAVKLELIRSLMMGTEVVVIDPEHEYKPVCEAFGGTFINVSLNSNERINMFDLPKPTDNAETGEQLLRSAVNSVRGLIGLMAGSLTPEEDNLLDRALYETYALKDINADINTHKNLPPTISDLMAVLRNTTGTESLQNRILKYAEGSFAGFFNNQTNIDLNNRLTVFSIRDMEEELRPVAMYLALNYIWTRVKSELKKRMLVMDEGWTMMRYEDSARFLTAMTKRARKYYLGVTVISQDVEDFINSAYGRSVVNNCSTQLLLGQSVTAVDKIAEIFKLTDGEKFFLTEAEVGQGLFLAGNNRAAIQIISSFVEDEIVTTNPEQILQQREVNA